jgi:hypothetical protein
MSDSSILIKSIRRTRILIVVLGIFSIFTILLMTLEVSSRNDLKRQVDQELVAVTSNLADRGSTDAALKVFRVELELISARIDLLRNTGASLKGSTLATLRCEFNNTLTARKTGELTAETPQQSVVACADEGRSLFFVVWASYLQSELLVALSIVLAGVAGAGTRALLSAAPPRHVTPMFAGAFSAFVGYLVVRGGRVFFFPEVSVQNDALSNPFSMTFFGAMIGLFSRSLFEELERRLNRMVQKGEEEEAAAERAGAENDQTGNEVKAGAVPPKVKGGPI